MTVCGEALADGYTFGLQFSSDLETWTTASLNTTGVSLTGVSTLSNGDQVMNYQFMASSGGKMMWRLVAN